MSWDVTDDCVACVFANSGKIAVWFEMHDPDSNTLAHECLHATLRTLEVRGCWPLSRTNEEAFAYLIGWLQEKLVDHFKKTCK